MDKLTHGLQEELHFSKVKREESKDGKLDQSGFIDDAEKEEFNKVMNGFIKNFQSIVKIDNILKNIDTCTNFFIKNNGSKALLDWRDKHKTENVDILDFWKDTEEWKTMNFSSEIEKYVWVFLKYDTKLYAVSLRQLEKFYGSIGKKNKEAKANDMSKMLNKIFKDIAETAQISQDLNKTVNLSYNVKVITFY